MNTVLGWLTVQIVETEDRAKPVPRQRDEWVSPPKAAEIAGVHRATVNRWCENFGRPFAKKVRGRWRVSLPALNALLKGEFEGMKDGTGRAA